MINRVDTVDNLVPLRNVLASVADKSGLEAFVAALTDQNPDICFYSTGGTYEKIREILAGLPRGRGRLISVSDYTGQPEMQGGLVKTLDFKIYLGLLSETYNQAHRDDLARTGAVEMDMVVGNLYPFKETVSRPGCTLEDARANIDIGGPCMIRAAAKNFIRTAAVCDPSDYLRVADTLKAHGGCLPLDFRYELAGKAFKHTADYDGAIAAYFASLGPEGAAGVYPRVN